uniref:Uncharacterized protein n=1 Tax=Aquila chrysaetos chrysaetos TaxID=223781 RepID=A0A663EV32_AQUCH
SPKGLVLAARHCWHATSLWVYTRCTITTSKPGAVGWELESLFQPFSMPWDFIPKWLALQPLCATSRVNNIRSDPLPTHPTRVGFSSKSGGHSQV